jgi:hypothetical protein
VKVAGIGFTQRILGDVGRKFCILFIKSPKQSNDNSKPMGHWVFTSLPPWLLVRLSWEPVFLVIFYEDEHFTFLSEINQYF